MTTQHTPAPWDFTGSIFTYDNGEKSRTYAIKNDDGYFIAQLHPFNGLPHDLKEAEANARLIAAAPELLAACEMALNEGDDYKAMEVIKAAIAKARGESCK